MHSNQVSKSLAGTEREDDDELSQYHKTGSTTSKLSGKKDEDSEQRSNSEEEEDNNELKQKGSEKMLVSVYVINYNINCLLIFVPFVGFSQAK